MEPNLTFSFLFMATFLLAYPHLASSRDVPAGEITLLQEPKSMYYIVKKKPATLTCQARYAADISFTCGGTKIPPTSVEVEDLSDTDPDVIQASIDVSRADVNNYVSEDDSPYWCECSAINLAEQPVVTSQRATIKVAQLKHKFSIQPISTTATRGEDIELICGAPAGDPKPTIIWRKDKKRVQIKSNDRFTLTDKGSLVISSIEDGDAGKYQCVARNMAGKRESQEALVNVTALAEAAEAEEEVAKGRQPRQSEGATFVAQPEKEYYVKADDTFTIDCKVKGAGIITFRCNGERMDRERQNTSQARDADGNNIFVSQLILSYTDVKTFVDKNMKNDRNYQCQCIAWYEDPTSERGWSYISSGSDIGMVYIKFLDDKFVKEPMDVTVGVGYEGMLSCAPPKGKPDPWVNWYKDGQKLDPRRDNRYRIDPKGSLIIKDVQYSDEGRYSCVAENGVKRVQSRPASLTVSAEPPPTTPAPTTPMAEKALTFPPVIPDSPTWVQNLEPQNTIGEDGVAKLVCTVVSAQQLSIGCNQRRLRENEYVFTRKRDRRTRKLLLSISTEVGAGDVAQNPDAYACVCTAWYREKGEWKKLLSNEGFVREVVQNYIDDEFVYPPSNVEAYYEGDVELTCEPPKGHPTPTVYWMKDNEKIDTNTDTNFVVLASGALVIEYVRLQDEGTYTCVAENEAGQRKSDPVALTIIGKPTSTTPEPETTPIFTSPEYSTFSSTDYISGLTEPFFALEPEAVNYIVTSDETVTLKCSVVNAKNLIFSCNNETVQESARTGFSTTDPQTGIQVLENSLTITAEMLENFRHKEPYTCVCQGYFIPEGETEWAYLESRAATIQRPFLRRRFKQSPEDTTGEIGTDVELVCRPPEGVPKPTVQWIKDGFRIADSEKYTITDEGSLIIKEAAEDDEGEYTCAAQNDFRKRTSSSVRVTIVASTEAPTVEPEPETTLMETAEPEYTSPEPEPSTLPPKGIPFISKDLHSVYYVIRNRPTTILCEAHDATLITFNCGMKDIPDVQSRGSVHQVVLPNGETDYVNVIEGEITVTKQDVEDYDGEFYCLCRAHYTIPQNAPIEEKGYIESQRGYVELAYLRRMFVQEPVNQRVYEGDFLSIPCQPPLGNPSPMVSWLKNGEPVETSSIAQGAFIISAASMEDGGEYVCVAENEAARRQSPPVLVEILPATTIDGVTDMETDSFTTEPDVTDDTTETDDPIIEVVVIKTDAPLTSDVTDDFSSSTYSTYSTYSTFSEMDSTTTDYQGSPEPIPDGKMSSHSPSGTLGPSSSEISTKTDDSVTQDLLTQTYDKNATLETSEEHFNGTETTIPTEEDIRSTDFVSEISPISVQDESTTDFVSDMSSSSEPDETTTIVLIDPTGESDSPSPEPEPEPTPTPEPEPEPEPDTRYSTYPDLKEDSTLSVMTNEAYSESDENNQGLRTTIPPTYPENHYTSDMPEDYSSTMGEKDMGAFPTLTMVDERKICTDLVSKCTSRMPENGDITEQCRDLPEYVKCINNFVDGCTDVVSDASIQAAQDVKENLQMQCEMLDKCPRLKECKTVYSNMESMDMTALSIGTFCSDVGVFMQCADQTLAECDVSMVSPKMNGQDSLVGMQQWLTSFCDQLVFGSPSLSSCEYMSECSLSVEIAAQSNSSYWCRLVDSIAECTEQSLLQCQMDDLLMKLDPLKMQAGEACHGDMIGEPNNGHDNMGGGDDNMGGHNTMDGGKNEGPAKAAGNTGEGNTDSSKDPDSAVSLGASVLLVTLAQVAVSAILSRR